MRKTKLLIGIIIGLTITYVGLKVFKQDTISDLVRPLILPLVTVLYCMKSKGKRGYFFYFLLLYSISEATSIFYPYSTHSMVLINLFYFGGNLLYIAAYTSLIIYVFRHFELKKAFNRFPIHILILLALDIYCVILVTEIAYKSDLLITVYDYIIEFVYNISIMLLLTASLINYLNRDSKKAMILLLGSICIVFSEVIQVAYYYVSEIYLLNIAYCLLLVVAFVLFYAQQGMLHKESKVFSTSSSVEKINA